MALPGRQRYCIFGCSQLGAYMHSFPHPEKRSDLFNAWVTVVGDKLKGINPLKIYKNKVVCDFHFSSTQKVASHRLIRNAVPCLHLQGFFSTPGTSVFLEHNYSLPRVYTGASTSKEQSSFEAIQTSTFDPSLDSAIQHTSFPPNVDEGLKSSAESALLKYKTAQKKVRVLKAQLRKSKKQHENFKTRLFNAKKSINGTNLFNKMTKNMTLSAKIFMGIQYRQALKKPRGRRYNLEEKFLSLSMYKKSPKCYQLLSKYFKLPSAKSLKNLLSDIKISPGINKVIFEKFKETVGCHNTEDNLCTLIFDEISITTHVQYMPSTDELKGFDSQSKELKLANHALVFMIRGINKNFKQPVAYYFTQGLKKYELKTIIKDVITHVQSTGLKVLCTVCDQGATNISAIISLIEDMKEKYLKKGIEWCQDMFEVGGQKIIHLYDVPHLLKGLRNNLITKDLIYTDSVDMKEKIIKWEYFQMLYEADKSFGELRLLHKLTEEHVVPKKIKKMRVHAVQVMSRSVAVTTNHIVARKILPEECQQLVSFVLMMDKIFDSLNVSNFHMRNGKQYTGGVKRNSPHHKLWHDAIDFLKSVKYRCEKKVGNKMRLIDKCIPSVTNLIKTIEGMQALWKILSQKYCIDCVLTRNFNQDPTENFFGNIRNLGVRNVSPNCHGFEGAYKTLLLNNFSVEHAVNSNCEEDFNVCLQSIEFFSKEKNIFYKTMEEEKNIVISPDLYEALSNVPTAESGGQTQSRYVCGWVLKKCLSKVIKGCKTCKETMISNSTHADEYIRAKEYDSSKQWLCYPSNALVLCFEEIQGIKKTYLKSDLCKIKFKENINVLIDCFVAFPFNCEKHKVKLREYFTHTTINIIVFSWCRSVNRILSGKITYRDNDDPVKIKAQMYYNTHRNKK